MLAELGADLGQHPLLVVEAGPGDGLLRQVIFDIAIDQILNGGRRPALALVTGDVDAPINLLA
jgi:hypothetical protein